MSKFRHRAWLIVLVAIIVSSRARAPEDEILIPKNKHPLGLVRILVAVRAEGSNQTMKSLLSGAIVGSPDATGKILGDQIVTAAHMATEPFDIIEVRRGNGTAIPLEIIDGERIAKYGDLLTLRLAQPQETDIVASEPILGENADPFQEKRVNETFEFYGFSKEPGGAKGMRVNAPKATNEEYKTWNSPVNLQGGNSGGPLLKRRLGSFVLRGVATMAWGNGFNAFLRVDNKNQSTWLNGSEGYAAMGSLMAKVYT
jgi:hypothetical protein